MGRENEAVGIAKAADFGKSMTKGERRPVGGRGDETFRLRAGRCPTKRCGPSEAPATGLLFPQGEASVPIPLVTCGTVPTGSGADTCRLASFGVSDPRFGRRRLPDIGNQGSGDEGVFGVGCCAARVVEALLGDGSEGLSCASATAETFVKGLPARVFAAGRGAAGVASMLACVR
jgi:hypothetical protein